MQMTDAGRGYLCDRASPERKQLLKSFAVEYVEPLLKHFVVHLLQFQQNIGIGDQKKKMNIRPSSFHGAGAMPWTLSRHSPPPARKKYAIKINATAIFVADKSLPDPAANIRKRSWRLSLGDWNGCPPVTP